MKDATDFARSLQAEVTGLLTTWLMGGYHFSVDRRDMAKLLVRTADALVDYATENDRLRNRLLAIYEIAEEGEE